MVLACQVIRTELPAHEIMQSMAIFQLDDKPADDYVVTALRCLASTFGIPTEALMCEYRGIYPYAEALRQQKPELTTVAVYKEVIQRKLRNPRRQEYKHFMQILSRFASWSTSTSGLEQRFSKGASAIGVNQGP